MPSSTNTNLAEILEEILLVLSDKERVVVTDRFALNNEPRKTLEKIGQHFSLTRERVRQIEASALKKLGRNISTTKLKHINEMAKNFLEKSGGVKKESILIAEILNFVRSTSKLDGSIIRLSLAADGSVKQERTSNFDIFWRFTSSSSNDVNLIADKANKILDKQKSLTDESRLINMIRAVLANSGKNFKNELIKSVLEIDPRLKKIDEEWGLMSWRDINPRSLRDKALIILRDYQKPLHFVEIANKIADHGFDKKIVTVQAVHNELIRDVNFILIGRGLYALSEWGYSEGTIVDVIEDLLKKNGPLSKEEIIRGVLKQRQVKKGTILLNLQKIPWFVPTGKALYKFSKAKKTGPEAERKRRKKSEKIMN
jgi:DNA-directed RNA polymerase delta subunit